MKSFPILVPHSIKNYTGVREVPWAFVETGRVRIESNHGQTLERLAQRGGLDWCELLYGLLDKKLDWGITKVDFTECHEQVMTLLHEWSK